MRCLLEPILIRQLGERALQPVAPAAAELVVVGVVGGNAVRVGGGEAVGAVEQHVDRQAHRQVAADGRVERDQGALGGFLERGVGADDAVDDGLASCQSEFCKNKKK